jgi:hypothetical protein
MNCEALDKGECTLSIINRDNWNVMADGLRQNFLPLRVDYPRCPVFDDPDIDLGDCELWLRMRRADRDTVKI